MAVHSVLGASQAPIVIEGMSGPAYHGGPGLSHSGVKRLLRSPFHFHALLSQDAPPKQSTPSMFNGTLVHCALLEPDEFNKRYVTVQATDKRSSEYKRVAEQIKGSELQLITEVQRDAALAQAAALRSLPEVATLLDGDGACEVSAYWIDPATGVLCKCRPDRVARVGYGKGAVLLDVKTTSDASPEAFAKSVVNFGYHTQADWYCQGYALASGLEVHGMVFAVVESEFPHARAAYMLDDEALRRAREDNRGALALYERCQREQTWPGYPSTIQVLSLPRWA